MVSVARILRDYKDAGSLNELLALWGFVDDSAFLTKAGHVGLVYRVQGIDYEGLTHQQRQALVHRVEAGLRLLDEHCRLYQHVIKRSIEPIVSAPCQQPIAHEAIQRRAAYLNGRRHQLYDIGLFLVLLHEAPNSARRSTHLHRVFQAPRQAFRGGSRARRRSSCSKSSSIARSALSTTRPMHSRSRRVNSVFAASERATRSASSGSLSTTTPFRRRKLTYDTHLDYFVSDASIECYRDHLLVGDRLVKVLSMKEPPSHTFALLLRDLYEIPGDLIACLEWQRISSDRMRRDLQTRRRHFFNKRVSIVNYVAPDTRPEEMLVDDSASATVRQLGDALTETEVNGHFFGHCSLTLVLHGTDPRALQQQAAEASKTIAIHDGAVFEETYNLLNGWLSVIPGNGSHNLRRLALLETNAADLSFVFTLDQGERVNAHLQREALAIFETPHHTPYAFNLHVQDVGHTLVLGATGSGKSFLLNFIVTHAQK